MNTLHKFGEGTPYRIAAILILLLAATRLAHAVGLKVSTDALERTLNKQLFTADGRYYIKGKPNDACFVYAEQPRISFHDDRVWVHIRTHSKLGAGLKGTCLGVSLTADADVSVEPEAQGETIGFRNARIEHLSTSRELNIFLVPFLNGKLPQQMKFNVADLIRTALAQSAPATGYTITLESMKIHSMQVDHNALVLDVDADVSVK